MYAKEFILSTKRFLTQSKNELTRLSAGARQTVAFNSIFSTHKHQSYVHMYFIISAHMSKRFHLYLYLNYTHTSIPLIQVPKNSGCTRNKLDARERQIHDRFADT